MQPTLFRVWPVAQMGEVRILGQSNVEPFPLVAFFEAVSSSKSQREVEYARYVKGTICLPFAVSCYCEPLHRHDSYMSYAPFGFERPTIAPCPPICSNMDVCFSACANIEWDSQASILFVSRLETTPTSSLSGSISWTRTPGPDLPKFVSFVRLICMWL